jgi:ribosome-associated protein
MAGQGSVSPAAWRRLLCGLSQLTGKNSIGIAMPHEPSSVQPGSGATVELAPGITIDGSALRYSFSRSGGPGGQAVNKLNTRAELRISLSAIRGLSEHAAARLRKLAGARLNRRDEIVLHSDQSRSQRDNREACFDRLCALVRKALVQPKKRKKVKPTRAMIERRLQTKRKRGERKSLRRPPEE